MRELFLKGTPNPRQAEFFRSPVRHTAYGGARGGGKSWAMRRKLVLLAFTTPELNALLLRRTLPELRENHVVPLLKELAGIAEYNATERVFRFPNGARLRLGYCDGANDVYHIKAPDGRLLLAPAIPQVVREVDVASKTMKITPMEGLFDL